ncbi:hypothetical protein [Moorena sp. SIO4G3]|uniref:hypothetical protein n=1 Tax=Moorena sp. SIO4G3 TaxID=2607821 RepID=UPI00142C5F16|nr:hypothetical protein [Moorena sp. SIO4G3]NEO79286.1 hypothetical protein [Moorena sp. SIO4G3]
MGRWGDGEIGRWGDREMGRWGDGEMGRWGDGEMGRLAEEKVVRLTATWYDSASGPHTSHTSLLFYKDELHPMASGGAIAFLMVLSN